MIANKETDEPQELDASLETELKAIRRERSRAIRALVIDCKARGVPMSRKSAADLVSRIMTAQYFGTRNLSVPSGNRRAS